jgi:hypothetical protein
MKNKLALIFTGIIMIYGLLVLTSALNLEQDISAKVVPGIIDVYSPMDGSVFQTNDVPFNLKIRYFSNQVKNFWLIEEKDMKLLCSKCDKFEKVVYFPTGEHSIRLKAEFINGDIAEKDTSFAVDPNSDIYLLSDGLIKKATTKELLNYLENYEFTLSYKREKVPQDFCSIRAKDGNIKIGEEDFSANSKVNFYSVLSLDRGQGSISAQKDRKRFNLKFNVVQTLENSDEILKLKVVDKNDEQNMLILELDKILKTVSLSGNNVLINEMNVYFIKGCNSKEDNFYLLEKGKKIKRSSEEIRNLLIDNPIFINRYENLRFVFKNFWKIRELLGLY